MSRISAAPTNSSVPRVLLRDARGHAPGDACVHSPLSAPTEDVPQPHHSRRGRTTLEPYGEDWFRGGIEEQPQGHITFPAIISSNAPCSGKYFAAVGVHPRPSSRPGLAALAGHALDLVEKGRIAQGQVLVERTADAVDCGPLQLRAEQGPVGNLLPCVAASGPSIERMRRKQGIVWTSVLWR